FFLLFCVFLCLTSVVFSQTVLESAKMEFNDYVERIDPTIEFILLTPQVAKDYHIEEWLEKDIGFSKWIVIFNEIPGKPPHSLQEKRVFRLNPERFHPLPFPELADMLALKKQGTTFWFIVSARGYLPGEKVIWRLVSEHSKEFKEIAFYPRPLVLKKKSGEILAKASLLFSLAVTTYRLDISGIQEEEVFKFLSASKHEKIRQVLKGPILMDISPDVIGSKGGIGEVTFSLEDGSSHKVELPWGSELFKYSRGEK
ncbi:MAG: hypothetical protein K2X08_04760, partial [Chlamydiales bacterium]|nr:hypothetical protein [Chlamydiales bacterium]